MSQYIIFKIVTINTVASALGLFLFLSPSPLRPFPPSHPDAIYDLPYGEAHMTKN